MGHPFVLAPNSMEGVTETMLRVFLAVMKQFSKSTLRRIAYWLTVLENLPWSIDSIDPGL